jgi:hypothetical protein
MVLYIDPGTGSMLFSIAIGLVTMLYFVGKAVLLKIKFLISGGRSGLSRKARVAYVLYSEGSRYWNVFKPILDEFESKATRVQFLTSSEDDPVFKENYRYVEPEFIGSGNRAFAKLNLLEADVCLMTTPGLDVYQLKRSKGVGHYAHILHAVDDATSYRLFGLDYFDSILLSGEYQKKHIRILERARGLKEKDLVVVGCPYLDVLNKKISLLADKSDTEITILVAPSWGPSGILSKYGERLLTPLVDSGFDIIVRPHPQTKTSEKVILESLMEMYKNDANLSWDFARENLGTLSKADVMISDFSGVIFDYTFLFNRPFLYVNAEFNAKPYDSWDIEEKPWKFRILPEIGVELQESQFSDIRQVLLDVLDNEELRSNREKAKDTAWQYRGDSGGRVYEYLVSKKNEMYPD